MSELPGMWDESDLRGGEADCAEDLLIVRKLKEENAALKEENERLRGMTAVLQFLEKADDLISVYPFLYVEIARTRVTDWMAWLRTKPKEGEGKTLAVGQGLTPDEACEAALAELNKQPGGEV